MQRNVTTLRIDEESSVQENSDNCTCDECGSEFQRPILATLTSQGSSEEYYACPRCLTKVAEAEDKQRREDGESEETSMPVRLESTKTLPDGDGECDHFMGYLKKRPKGTAIPDGCLTCTKMVECLSI